MQFWNWGPTTIWHNIKYVAFYFQNHSTQQFRRVEWGIFFIGQNRSSNHRLGMISEVQIQILACQHEHQSFHFQQIPGSLNIFFFWKLAQSFFYIKEKLRFYNICASIVLKAKTEKIKKKNWVTPKKECLWVWKTILEKNCSSSFTFVLAVKTIDAQMFSWSIQFFWKSTKSY